MDPTIRCTRLRSYHRSCDHWIVVPLKSWSQDKRCLGAWVVSTQSRWSLKAIQWFWNLLIQASHMISWCLHPQTFLRNLKNSIIWDENRWNLNAFLLNDPTQLLAKVDSQRWPFSLFSPLQTSNGLQPTQVFALGNPFGLEHSMSLEPGLGVFGVLEQPGVVPVVHIWGKGVISGLSRSMDGAGGWPMNGNLASQSGNLGPMLGISWNFFDHQSETLASVIRNVWIKHNLWGQLLSPRPQHQLAKRNSRHEKAFSWKPWQSPSALLLSFSCRADGINNKQKSNADDHCRWLVFHPRKNQTKLELWLSSNHPLWNTMKHDETWGFWYGIWAHQPIPAIGQTISVARPQGRRCGVEPPLTAHECVNLQILTCWCKQIVSVK